MIEWFLLVILCLLFGYCPLLVLIEGWPLVGSCCLAVGSQGSSPPPRGRHRILRIKCSPESVDTTSDNSFTFSAKAASSKAFCILGSCDGRPVATQNGSNVRRHAQMLLKKMMDPKLICEFDGSDAVFQGLVQNNVQFSPGNSFYSTPRRRRYFFQFPVCIQFTRWQHFEANSHSTCCVMLCALFWSFI